MKVLPGPAWGVTTPAECGEPAEMSMRTAGYRHSYRETEEEMDGEGCLGRDFSLGCHTIRHLDSLP